MVKIVLEVSEEFIRDNADPQKVKVNAEVSGKSALNTLVNVITFSVLENEVNEGKKEFTLKQENFSENEKRLFTSALGELALLIIGSKKEAGDEK